MRRIKIPERKIHRESERKRERERERRKYWLKVRRIQFGVKVGDSTIPKSISSHELIISFMGSVDRAVCTVSRRMGKTHELRAPFSPCVSIIDVIAFCIELVTALCSVSHREPKR